MKLNGLICFSIGLLEFIFLKRSSIDGFEMVIWDTAILLSYPLKSLVRIDFQICQLQERVEEGYYSFNDKKEDS